MSGIGMSTLGTAVDGLWLSTEFDCAMAHKGLPINNATAIKRFPKDDVRLFLKFVSVYYRSLY